MMNQSTPSIDYPEYLELLEAQRKCLVELMTPCDYPDTNHPKEPHAYHSDDTYDDLRSALEIYAALIDFLIDGEAALPNLNAWFTEQVNDAIQSEAGMPDLENDFDEPMALFACDAITSEFQTIFTRFYQARKAN